MRWTGTDCNLISSKDVIDVYYDQAGEGGGGQEEGGGSQAEGASGGDKQEEQVGPGGESLCQARQ